MQDRDLEGATAEQMVGSGIVGTPNGLTGYQVGRMGWMHASGMMYQWTAVKVTISHAAWVVAAYLSERQKKHKAKHLVMLW